MMSHAESQSDVSAARLQNTHSGILLINLTHCLLSWVSLLYSGSAAQGRNDQVEESMLMTGWQMNENEGSRTTRKDQREGRAKRMHNVCIGFRWVWIIFLFRWHWSQTCFTFFDSFSYTHTHTVKLWTHTTTVAHWKKIVKFKIRSIGLCIYIFVNMRHLCGLVGSGNASSISRFVCMSGQGCVPGRCVTGVGVEWC